MPLWVSSPYGFLISCSCSQCHRGPRGDRSPSPVPRGADSQKPHRCAKRRPCTLAAPTALAERVPRAPCLPRLPRLSRGGPFPPAPASSRGLRSVHLCQGDDTSFWFGCPACVLFCFELRCDTHNVRGTVLAIPKRVIPGHEAHSLRNRRHHLSPELFSFCKLKIPIRH